MAAMTPTSRMECDLRCAVMGECDSKVGRGRMSVGPPDLISGMSRGDG